jgi:hypothetical protein
MCRKFEALCADVDNIDSGKLATFEGAVVNIDSGKAGIDLQMLLRPFELDELQKKVKKCKNKLLKYN